MNQYFNWGYKKSLSWYLRQKRNACSSRKILIKALIEIFLPDYQCDTFFSGKKVRNAGNKNAGFVVLYTGKSDKKIK